MADWRSNVDLRLCEIEWRLSRAERGELSAEEVWRLFVDVARHFEEKDTEGSKGVSQCQ